MLVKNALNRANSKKLKKIIELIKNEIFCFEIKSKVISLFFLSESINFYLRGQ